MQKGQTEQHHAEITLHSLQTLRQQTLAIFITLRLHVICHTDFRQEKDEGQCHNNNIAHGQLIGNSIILCKNQASKRNTCQIQAAEITCLNLAFQNIGSTGQQREYPQALQSEPGSTANHNNVINQTMSVAGAAVQHAQNKEQPQHYQDIAFTHKISCYQRQTAADETAELTVRIKLQS